MGVPKYLGKIRMFIVHILDITTFLTFTWWLLHANKVTDSAAQCGSSGCSGRFLADPRGRGAKRGTLELSVCTRMKHSNIRILSFIHICFCKITYRGYFREGESYCAQKEASSFHCPWTSALHQLDDAAGCPAGCWCSCSESWDQADLQGFVWRCFFQIPAIEIFPGFLGTLSAKISVVDGKTGGEHTDRQQTEWSKGTNIWMSRLFLSLWDELNEDIDDGTLGKRFKIWYILYWRCTYLHERGRHFQSWGSNSLWFGRLQFYRLWLF